MITCPNCGQHLHDQAIQCQFCGADLTAVQRPYIPGQTTPAGFQLPTGWEHHVYKAVSIYYIIDGVIMALAGLGVVDKPSIFNLVSGVVNVVFGVGLLLNISWIRAVVNFLCFWQILSGLFDLGLAIIAGFFAGPIVILLMLLNAIQIVAAGLMIYVLGETETRGPNF